MAEKIAGLLALIASMAWFIISFSLAQNNFGGELGLGPAFYPRLVSCLMMVMSAIYIFQIFKARESPIKLKVPKTSILMMAGVVAYLLLLSVIGYAVTTFLYVLVSIYMLGKKKSFADLAAAFLVVLCLYGVFHVLLQVPLPSGLLI